MRRATEVELRRMREGQAKPADALEGSANQWADKRKNEEQFSYDADEVTERWWRDEGEALMKRIASDGVPSPSAGGYGIFASAGNGGDVSISASAKL